MVRFVIIGINAEHDIFYLADMYGDDSVYYWTNDDHDSRIKTLVREYDAINFLNDKKEHILSKEKFNNASITTIGHQALSSSVGSIKWAASNTFEL